MKKSQNKKDKLVCPFCQQLVKGLSEGLQVKEIAKTYKQLEKLLKKPLERSNQAPILAPPWKTLLDTLYGYAILEKE